MPLLTETERVKIADVAYLAMLGEHKSFPLFASGRQQELFIEVLGAPTYWRFVRIIQGLAPLMYEGYFESSH